MSQILGRKWWLILLQGVLLVILSIYIFNNPAGVLAGISFWFGVIVLAAGLVGIIAWFAGSKPERENFSLLWAIITFGFGLFFLFNLLATMKTLTVVFGLWCLLSGLFLLNTGWSLRKYNSTGWVMVIAGSICVVAAIMMISNIGTGAIAISTLLGLLSLITGISLVMLSFAKRMVVKNLKDKIDSIR
jgi:uncharacterized membrane protein HdeD (DUF308 family)